MPSRPARNESGEPARLTIVSGPERLLVRRALGSVTARVQKVAPDLERRSVDAGSGEASGSLLNALSPSLFGEPALVVVGDLADAPDQVMSVLLSGLADLADDVWVVAIHSGARNKKALEALRKAPVSGSTLEIPCAEVKRGAATRSLLESEAREAGRRITPDGVEALVLALGSDIALLVGGLEQLMADNPHGDITADVVAEAFAGAAEISGFQLADALWGAQGTVAMRRLRQGLASQSFTGPAVVGSMAASLRALVRVMGAPRGMSEEDVARMAGVPPFRVRALRAMGRTWEPARLAAATIELAATDAAVKGGLRLGENLDPAQKELALEAFVLRTSQRSRAGRGQSDGRRT